jgi:hypothetical protein
LSRIKCPGISMPHGPSAHCLTCQRFGEGGVFQPVIASIRYTGASLPVVDCRSRVHVDSVTPKRGVVHASLVSLVTGGIKRAFGLGG